MNTIMIFSIVLYVLVIVASFVLFVRVVDKKPENSNGPSLGVLLVCMLAAVAMPGHILDLLSLALDLVIMLTN